MPKSSLRLLIAKSAFAILIIAAIAAFASSVSAGAGRVSPPVHSLVGRYLIADQENFQTRFVAEVSAEGPAHIEGIVSGRKFDCRGEARLDRQNQVLTVAALCNGQDRAVFRWNLQNTDSMLLARGLVTSMTLTVLRRPLGESRFHTIYDRVVDLSQLGVSVH